MKSLTKYIQTKSFHLLGIISNCIKFIIEQFRIQKTKVLKLTSPLPDLETALSRKYIGLI